MHPLKFSVDINNEAWERKIEMKKLIVSVALSPDVVESLDLFTDHRAKISRSSLIEEAVRLYLAIENSDNRHQKSAQA